MKKYSVQEIIEQVRIKYDELELNESEMVVCPDDMDLESVILSCINTAFRFVVLNADISMLEGKHISNTDKFYIDDDLVGHIPLPDDFLRGISVRLSSWESSPSEVIDERSAEYRMQSDPYACGTSQNPVAAIVHTSNGREMELYKADSKEDIVKSFIYVPFMPDNTDYAMMDIQVPDLLSEAFIYYIAGLTATTFREDVANDFFKVAKGLLGNESSI